jgi:N-acetylmuramoyl-L-alanine amidase
MKRVRRVGVLWLVVLTAARARAAVPVLERVELSGGGAPVVRLHLSADATAIVHPLAPDGPTPARVYVDIKGANLSPGARTPLAGKGPVLRVRSGQFDPTTTRVVVELDRVLPYDFTVAGRTITLRFTAPPTAGAAALPPAPAVPPPPSAEPPPLAVPPPSRAPTPSVHEAPPPSSAAPEHAPAATQDSGVASEHAGGTPAPERSMPPRAAASPARPEAHARPAAPAADAAPAPVPPAHPDAPASVAPATPRAAEPGPPVASTQPPLIVIDPGHGGRDPGAEGVGGVREKDVVLELAHRLASKLARRLPVSVILTRSEDAYVPVQDRLPSPEPPVAAFVSLHANACRDPQAGGVEIFYGGGLWHSATTTGADPRARALGRALARALDAKIGAVRGDARPGAFAVLVRNPAPAALIEVGFLTHPADAALARAESFQEVLTDALVDGLAAFLRLRTQL